MWILNKGNLPIPGVTHSPTPTSMDHVIGNLIDASSFLCVQDHTSLPSCLFAQYTDEVFPAL